jgi:peptidoglycan/LPS O-acetylase OafA/YrhL
MTAPSSSVRDLAYACPGPTLADRLNATAGRPSGSDYMRLILALGVVVWHSPLISYGFVGEIGPWQQYVAPFAMLIVPMFFALSGFLVAGSLERSRTIFSFLGLRVFRIMPALAVQALLCALILGPLLTTYSLRDYFTASELRGYLLNIIGHIHYSLPGVFQNNPVTLVNGQLWTVPYELVCYVILALLAVCGIFSRRRFLVCFLGACYLAQVVSTIFRPSTEFQGAGGSSIVMAFMAGLLLFRYRDKIVWSKLIFSAALILSIALPMFVPKGMRFAALPVAYLTVYLSLMNPPRDRIVLSGDYSYGVFLYGFPVQQAIYTLLPFARNWYTSLLISVPCTVLIATASWWLVEKPVLGHRNKLKMAEAWYLRQFRRVTA